MEILDRLHSARLLSVLIFYGGTMLRLCHGLDRFSVDLDFRLQKPTSGTSVLARLRSCLEPWYRITDAAEKFYTLVVELRSTAYPRALKIEIRKEGTPVHTEKAIAYSPHSTRQVLVTAATLPDMMALKTRALIERKEIRDAYDIEFLLKRGIALVDDGPSLQEALETIASFPLRHYSAKLGPLLEPAKRAYYREHNFRILKAAVAEKLAHTPQGPSREKSAGSRP
jgi:predicted nucleotidyltransferase component of viral defense system